MPQNEAGMRIEPPPSVPTASGARPAATAAPAPPDEPPGVSSAFHGLRVMPPRGLSVTPLCPSSGVVVLPIRIAPAPFRRSTATASSSGTWSANRREPAAVSTRRVNTRSFTDTGTPCSGPRPSPDHHARLRGEGGVPRLVGADGEERVEPWIQPLDPREHRIDDLDRRDLLRADAAGELEGGQPGEVRCHAPDCITGRAPSAVRVGYHRRAMDPAAASRLAACLARPELRRHAPDGWGALRAALEGPDPPVAVGRWGALAGFAAGPGRRRLVEVDRRGHLVAALSWNADGSLARAKCRTAAGEWIGIAPGAARHPAWGAADQLWLLEDGAPFAETAPLTVFQALDYARPDFIPPLWEPARLPSGAGTAVLNLVAQLMKDQGAARVRYRGPYPTEQLFVSLLESFRYDPAISAPLDHFLDGADLDWLPAPHERHRVADAVTVQCREEPDKVVLGGQAFYRPDWQGVVRREPYRLRRDGDRLVCSLWALDRALEDRLVLAASGEVLAAPPAAVDPRPAAPLPPIWTAALAALIARESAAPLAPAIAAAVAALRLWWGPSPGDLLRVAGDEVTLARRLRDEGLAWVGAAPAGPGRGERAARLALEVARLLGPLVRGRAQAHLEALPEAEQARALSLAEAGPRPLGESVGRLLALLSAGSG